MYSKIKVGVKSSVVILAMIAIVDKIMLMKLISKLPLVQNVLMI